MHYQNSYAPRGFSVLAVSMDSPTDAKQALAVARQKKANFPIFIIKGSLEAFVGGVDARWEGGYPRTYLIDRKGKVRKVIPGGIDPASTEALLKKLLAEKKGGTFSLKPGPRGFLHAS